MFLFQSSIEAKHSTNPRQASAHWPQHPMDGSRWTLMSLPWQVWVRLVLEWPIMISKETSCSNHYWIGLVKDGSSDAESWDGSIENWLYDRRSKETSFVVDVGLGKERMQSYKNDLALVARGNTLSRHQQHKHVSLGKKVPFHLCSEQFQGYYLLTISYLLTPTITFAATERKIMQLLFPLSNSLSSQTGALCLQHMLRCWLLQKC
jgi:hypothetical protein